MRAAGPLGTQAEGDSLFIRDSETDSITPGPNIFVPPPQVGVSMVWGASPLTLEGWATDAVLQVQLPVITRAMRQQSLIV